jgi:predicted transcriptional regulator
VKIFDYLDKIDIFNRLVEQRRTGTPEELAERLGISRNTLYDLLDELRSRNVEVAYSRTSRTFYYKNSISLEVRLSIKHLEAVSASEAKNITGGCKIFPSVLFFGRKDFTFVPE